MWNRLLPRTWNDVLSLWIVVGIPILLAVHAFADVITGQLLTGWLATIYFYFRKAMSETTNV